MSLTDSFTPTLTSEPPVPWPRKRRVAPFSLRLSKEERARLIDEASGVPLGTYIRAKVLGETPPIRVRRSGISVENRRAFAQLVAVLGRSRLANNLNQLARLAHVGALPVTPELEAELSTAVADVREIRRLLLVALGLKSEDAP
ncbi:hypothetical protein [Phenylobacterium sp.]|uniref:hypothetical protein n=1 Tax=Phenylobacterium sp. TaxID=1871053 RepID=UPI002F41F5C6